MTKKSEREREQERRANMPGPNGKEARVIARRLIAPETSEDERSEAGRQLQERRVRVEQFGRTRCETQHGGCGNCGVDCTCDDPFYPRS